MSSTGPDERLVSTLKLNVLLRDRANVFPGEELSVKSPEAMGEEGSPEAFISESPSTDPRERDDRLLLLRKDDGLDKPPEEQTMCMMVVLLQLRTVGTERVSSEREWMSRTGCCTLPPEEYSASAEALSSDWLFVMVLPSLTLLTGTVETG